MTEILKISSDNFEEVVKNADVPVLVDFGAEWCGPCKRMEPHVENLAKDFSGKAKVGKIDVGESQDLAGRFGVMSVPTVIVFKNGKIMEQSVGYLPKDKLAQLLRKHL